MIAVTSRAKICRIARTSDASLERKREVQDANPKQLRARRSAQPLGGKMWWRGQNLSKPAVDGSGQKWHFRVWHGSPDNRYTQRIYFWNDDRSETGMLEVVEEQSLHVSKLKQRIAKLAKDAAFRRPYLKPLQFPVERHYA
jgi:hypothetical protein